MYLYEYMLHYAKSECLKMGLLMLKQKKNYQQTVIGLLKKHPDTQFAIKEFKKRCPAEIDAQFSELV